MSKEKFFSNTKSSYLIVISHTKNNLYINVNNSITGHLIRTFSFGHIGITEVDHRKRTIFSGEFGTHFGKYFNDLNLFSNIQLKIKGSDPRSYALIKGFIKTGGFFNEIILSSNTPHNGCRSAKQKRL
jgi:ribosomal protein S11